jgi:hypothetical protein
LLPRGASIAAATLAATFIVAGTIVDNRSRAIALAGAGVGPALAMPLASIQSTTDVKFHDAHILMLLSSFEDSLVVSLKAERALEEVKFQRFVKATTSTIHETLRNFTKSHERV